MPAPPREKISGYRRYPRGTVGRLRFIESLQGAGFTLDDIRRILRLADDPASCDAVQALARTKLKTVHDRIAALERCALILQEIIDNCGRQGGARCHLFDLMGETGNGGSDTSEPPS